MALGHLLVLVARKRSGYVPFAPALAGSAILYTLYGDWIVTLIFPSVAELLGISPI